MLLTRRFRSWSSYGMGMVVHRLMKLPWQQGLGYPRCLHNYLQTYRIPKSPPNLHRLGEYLIYVLFRPFNFQHLRTILPILTCFHMYTQSHILIPSQSFRCIVQGLYMYALLILHLCFSSPMLYYHRIIKLFIAHRPSYHWHGRTFVAII